MLPCPLPDVSMDRYFGKAVLWASQNQLVLGRGNGIFDPDGTISRQDMVTVFYRYAKLMEIVQMQPAIWVNFQIPAGYLAMQKMPWPGL